ncbi:hypothetical protein TNCV_4528921 [Trichonephila clavipes]|nr:hypothetical protein TNCV_4528921 [Trichonephila clavipes]
MELKCSTSSSPQTKGFLIFTIETKPRRFRRGIFKNVNTSGVTNIPTLWGGTGVSWGSKPDYAGGPNILRYATDKHPIRANGFKFGDVSSHPRNLFLLIANQKAHSRDKYGIGSRRAFGAALTDSAAPFFWPEGNCTPTPCCPVTTRPL